MDSLYFVGILFITFVFVSGMPGHADTAIQSETLNQGLAIDERPANANATLSLRPFHNSEHTDVTVDVWYAVTYPARSAHEASLAQNGTLETNWFSGPALVRQVVETYPESRLTDEKVNVEYSTEGSSEHGRITFSYEARWNSLYGTSRDRVVLGPTFGERLAVGDEIVVVVGSGHEVVSASAEPDIQKREAGSWSVYNWTIGEDPSPRIVLKRDFFQTHLFDAPLVGSVYLGQVIWGLITLVIPIIIAVLVVKIYLGED